jgi:hypothetical protein
LALQVRAVLGVGVLAGAATTSAFAAGVDAFVAERPLRGALSLFGTETASALGAREERFVLTGAEATVAALAVGRRVGFGAASARTLTSGVTGAAIAGTATLAVFGAVRGARRGLGNGTAALTFALTPGGALVAAVATVASACAVGDAVLRRRDVDGFADLRADLGVSVAATGATGDLASPLPCGDATLAGAVDDFVASSRLSALSEPNTRSIKPGN